VDSCTSVDDEASSSPVGATTVRETRQTGRRWLWGLRGVSDGAQPQGAGRFSRRRWLRAANSDNGDGAERHGDLGGKGEQQGGSANEDTTKQQKKQK
jgi:hypothetical protein